MINQPSRFQSKRYFEQNGFAHNITKHSDTVIIVLYVLLVLRPLILIFWRLLPVLNYNCSIRFSTFFLCSCLECHLQHNFSVLHVLRSPIFTRVILLGFCYQMIRCSWSPAVVIGCKVWLLLVRYIVTSRSSLLPTFISLALLYIWLHIKL